MLVHEKQRMPAQVTAQFCFTCIFGWYAALILTSTGQLLSVVTVHAFCNIMGFPDFAVVLQHDHSRIVGSVFAAGIIGFGASLGWVGNPALWPAGKNVNDSRSYMDLMHELRPV